MNAPCAPPGVGRDHRLDVLRGLALLTIFVNHVPGNVYEAFTSRNFGFSDAAEAFVLMSGIAVGLAYSGGFRRGDHADAVKRVWKRAATLYGVHIVTTVIAIAVVAAGILYLGLAEYTNKVNFARLLDSPLEAMIGIPTLGHQLGYFNILPMYFVLLLASPIFLVVGLRSREALIAMAAAIWILVGVFRLNLPNYPNPGGWFFNPLAWQLVYAIGIAGGLAMTEGRKLVPFNRTLFWGCVVFLAFSCLWLKLRMGPLPGRKELPFFIAGFDKTFLALPRLLHVLALAYVLTNMQSVARLLRTPVFRPIELIGRNGLAVFATGSVLSIALQVFRSRFETGWAEDTLLIAAGIAAQYAVARIAAAQRKPRLAVRAAPAEPAAPVQAAPRAKSPQTEPAH